MQIRPYHTSEKKLDGAVLAFVDVDALRRAIQEAESARDYARSIVETVRSALMVLDAEQRVVSANTAFYDAFSLSPKAAVNSARSAGDSGSARTSRKVTSWPAAFSAAMDFFTVSQVGIP